jgi:hypothetical protein
MTITICSNTNALQMLLNIFPGAVYQPMPLDATYHYLARPADIDMQYIGLI